MIDTITKYLSIGLGAIALVLLIYCLMLRNDRDNALNKLDKANQTITALNAYIDKTKEQLKAIQQLDKDYQEQLNHAQTENDKLRDSIANGTKRLYVKTACPVSSNTATTSSVNATTSRLAEDARPYYLRLRLEIEQTRMQVLSLQSYITNACLR